MPNDDFKTRGSTSKPGAAKAPQSARGLGGAGEDWETRPGSEPTQSSAAKSPPLSAAAHSGSAADELPEQFGRYRVLKPLGHGGMGSVYLAHDSQLERQVALKVPHFRADDDPQILERFYREARAAATIEHPNICPVYDVGEIQGIHYVTMAYIEGRPLRDLIQDGKLLPQRPVAAVVRKLALALHEAHTRGVVHRDLKPSNIMINHRKEPVVMDFGLALRADQGTRLTQNGALLGTPAYMPPEQVHGDVQAMGPGCDIYSLGVILYEMLTGQLPFQGPLTSVLAQIVTQEPKPPSQVRPDVEPGLEAICVKAMAKQIKARYASMNAFAADLTEYLKDDVKPAKRSPAATAVPRAAPETVSVLPTATLAEQPAGEGLATQLLARLVDRLDPKVASNPSATIAEPPRRAHGARVLFGIAALVIIGTGVAYVATRSGNSVHVDTTVLVQLQGLSDKVNNTTVTLILLDGRPVTKEELANPVSLSPGEHELVMKGSDGGVLHSVKFPVGRQDDRGAISIAGAETKVVDDEAGTSQVENKAKSPVTAQKTTSGVLDPANLLAKDAPADLAALEKHFIIHKASYDPDSRKVALVVEARRDFSSVSRDVSLSARFYDPDDGRVHSGSLTFEQSDVKQGMKARATFSWPRNLQSPAGKRSKLLSLSSKATAADCRLLLVEREATEFPAGPRAEFPKLDLSSLPGKAGLDVKALQETFLVHKVQYNPDSRWCAILVEARRPISSVQRHINLNARFYDDEGLRIDSRPVSSDQSDHVLQGERIWLGFNWISGVAGPGRTTAPAKVSRVVLESQ